MRELQTEISLIKDTHARRSGGRRSYLWRWQTGGGGGGAKNQSNLCRDSSYKTLGSHTRLCSSFFLTHRGSHLPIYHQQWPPQTAVSPPHKHTGPSTKSPSSCRIPPIATWALDNVIINSSGDQNGCRNIHNIPLLLLQPTTGDSRKPQQPVSSSLDPESFLFFTKQTNQAVRGRRNTSRTD